LFETTRRYEHALHDADDPEGLRQGCAGSDNEVIEVRQVFEMSDFPADVQEVAAKFPDLQSQHST
jgi:K+/H+ antiporter YhaU regulatory subunit KhtT